MKILYQDAKTNEIKLLPETLDDLWHLYNLIDERDLVFATTYRRGEEKSDKLRPDRPDKLRMRLGIRVQKVEFEETGDVLRVLGQIEQGPQDIGQHHTLMIALAEAVSIIKPEWRPQHFDRIKRAVEASETPSIFFVSIEDTEAVIVTSREYGLKENATITRSSTGKMYEAKSTEKEYLDEVADKLAMSHKHEPVVLLGPGFEKEALAKRLREKYPEIAKHMVVHHTGQAGMAGIRELMKMGIGGKMVEESRVALETRLMEELFAELGKNGMFAYGDRQVKEAADAGAIKTLLILDTKVRSPEVDRLIRAAESSKGEFVIISSLHEAGKRLDSLGGIAALLRYKIG